MFFCDPFHVRGPVAENWSDGIATAYLLKLPFIPSAFYPLCFLSLLLFIPSAYYPFCFFTVKPPKGPTYQAKWQVFSTI